MSLVLLVLDSLPSDLMEVAKLLGARVVHSHDEPHDAILLSQPDQLQDSTVPLWVVPRANIGSDAVYQMIPQEEEYPNMLKAVWPLRLLPAIRELKQVLNSSSLGRTLHLQMERVLAPDSGLSVDKIESAWLPDADLLRSLCGGEFRRVTAIHSGIQHLGVSTASVSLAGEGVPDAMWTLRTGATARCELTVTTELGAAVVAWSDGAPPTLTVNCKEVSLCSRIRENSAATAGATAGDTTLTTSPPPGKRVEQGVPDGVTPWADVVRAFDLLDAARRSLKRRRTVELQFESTSERSQFKTHMTTIGCGLLLFTMFGLIGLLFAGRMLDPRDAQQKQSEVAGFVLRETDFEGATLNSLGRETLTEIVAGYERRSATILIEGPSEADATAQQRRGVVVQALTDAGLPAAQTRTLVRPLKGQWFKRLLTAAWVLLFLPLGIFLGGQFLLTVTPEDRTAGRRER